MTNEYSLPEGVRVVAPQDLPQLIEASLAQAQRQRVHVDLEGVRQQLDEARRNFDSLRERGLAASETVRRVTEEERRALLGSGWKASKGERLAGLMISGRAQLARAVRQQPRLVEAMRAHRQLLNAPQRASDVVTRLEGELKAAEAASAAVGEAQELGLNLLAVSAPVQESPEPQPEPEEATDVSLDRDAQIFSLHEQGISNREIGRRLEMGETSVRRVLARTTGDD
jgi:hypothetical protein